MSGLPRPARRAVAGAVAPSEREDPVAAWALLKASMGRPPQKLRHGPHGLDPGEVAAIQRRRTLAAFLEVVGECGYARASVVEATARARVSKKTFHDLFGTKTACFLAVYDLATAALLQELGTVYASIPEASPARAKAILAALLELFSSEPELARLCLVDVHEAGPEALERYCSIKDVFVSWLSDVADYEGFVAPGGTTPPHEDLRRAVVGGVVSAIEHYVAAGQAGELPRLLPHLTYFVLVPFIGEKRAAASAWEEERRAGAEKCSSALARAGK